MLKMSKRVILSDQNLFQVMCNQNLKSNAPQKNHKALTVKGGGCQPLWSA